MLEGIHDKAIARVRAWLDAGPGSRWARAARYSKRLGGAWEIPLGDAPGGVQGIRLVLPATFPTDPCRFYVDQKHFLQIPHVEADGHVCLGLPAYPSDYDDPEGAVVRALEMFQDDLLRHADDQVWREEQFHAERISYWMQWSVSRGQASGRRSVSRRTYIDMGELEGWQAMRAVAYTRPHASGPGRAHQIVVAGNEDPNDLAARHGWAKGMMVRGDALLVRLPSELRWTPSVWPQSFEALERLLADVTGHELSLVAWLEHVGWGGLAEPVLKKRLRRGSRERRGSFSEQARAPRPLLVILVHEGMMFGYQLFSSPVPGLTTPVIEPIAVTRIDPAWALARDQQSLVLRTRRKRRVLLLGCGSLGSPLAKALARSGLGHLDLVDAQLMESENTSRHELGLDDVGLSKAESLALRLRIGVPGLSVKGHCASVQDWVPKYCRPGAYDLVIECTAESSVRTFLSRARAELFGTAPIIHAWAEPLCSAGHVVLTQIDTPWPAFDPADSHVNASDLSGAGTLVRLPACAGGFHPYGAADIQLIAAFAAERILGTLDELDHRSTVWSWVRSSAFFEGIGHPIDLRPIVPRSASKWDSAMLTRDLATVLERA